jgi:hypothetical protein
MSYYQDDHDYAGRRRYGTSHEAAQSLATGLGWFSLALGVTEVLAPRALARWLGMEGSEPILRAYGLREIATGIAILSSDNPAPWVWGRVGGDAIDLATLAPGLHPDNPQRGNVGIALGAVAGVTALDVVCAGMLSAGVGEPPRRLVDYSDRSGLPAAPEQMRGAASDFETPKDFRAPEALRPYAQT